ncbi:hypothetical protein FQZ97_846230 [compost metagenome]
MSSWRTSSEKRSLNSSLLPALTARQQQQACSSGPSSNLISPSVIRSERHLDLAQVAGLTQLASISSTNAMSSTATSYISHPTFRLSPRSTTTILTLTRQRQSTRQPFASSSTNQSVPLYGKKTQTSSKAAIQIHGRYGKTK